MTAMAELQHKGLVRHLGLSNATPRQIAQARGIADIVCVQNQYNLAHRGDDALIDALAHDGIAYVPFFPLGGFSPLQSAALSAVDRKRVVSGKRVSVRINLGGRRIITKKTQLERHPSNH